MRNAVKSSVAAPGETSLFRTVRKQTSLHFRCAPQYPRLVIALWLVNKTGGNASDRRIVSADKVDNGHQSDRGTNRSRDQSARSRDEFEVMHDSGAMATVRILRIRLEGSST